MNKFESFLNENIVLLDGGMGTLLQARGLAAGELPERWNLSHPEVIVDIQTQYFNAGSNVVCTNTFGANVLKFSEQELEEIVKSAMEIARAAQKNAKAPQEKFPAEFLCKALEHYCCSCAFFHSRSSS